MKILRNLLIVVIVISMFGCVSKEMKKAKEYLDASMFQEAITLLEIEIQNNPKNAEANFLLDKCYLNLNRQNVCIDLNDLSKLAMTFYRMPVGLSGGGWTWTSNVDNLGYWFNGEYNAPDNTISNEVIMKMWTYNVDNLGDWFNREYNATDNTISNENGTYHFSINDDVLTIIGTGNVTSKDNSISIKATVIIIGKTGSITTTINN